MHDRQSSCLRGRCIEAAWRIFPKRPALEILHQSRYLDCGREHERSLSNVYSPVFARPLIDLPEPELVHAADFAGREALVHPRFVDYLLGRDQQCRGFSSLELPHRSDTESIAEYTAAGAKLKFGLRANSVIASSHGKPFA